MVLNEMVVSRTFKLIRNSYTKNSVCIKVEKPEKFKTVFYSIMRQVIENWKGGMNIGARKINDLRYTDDAVIIAADETELAALLNRTEDHLSARNIKPL